MPEFISVIRDSMAPGGRIIEIGGSSGGYRRPLLDLGFRFVTTDYNAPAADLLADAHALPFKDGCAEAVLMQAASQAFENPLVAFRETARVLSEGGLLVGTADCCAVFASSFYNITPFGVLALLEASNLVLERLWILKDALEFCGTNPGYPAVVKPFLRGLSRLARLPLLTPRNLLGGRRRGALITAGSFAFVARKRQFPPA
jgi:SAM-dependent methyltransferase